MSQIVFDMNADGMGTINVEGVDNGSNTAANLISMRANLNFNFAFREGASSTIGMKPVSDKFNASKLILLFLKAHSCPEGVGRGYLGSPSRCEEA